MPRLERAQARDLAALFRLSGARQRDAVSARHRMRIAEGVDADDWREPSCLRVSYSTDSSVGVVLEAGQRKHGYARAGKRDVNQ